MKDDFLHIEIKKLQDNYKKILETGLDAYSNRYYKNIIDEINIFWYANRNLVKLILQTISPQFNCYAFTGASFLDLEDNEHFPFVMLGDTHILDDPLFGFTKIFNDITDGPFVDEIKKQIELTIVDNIRILENYSNIIFILPLRQLTSTNVDLLKKASDQAFLSLFKDREMTIKDYLSSYSSLAEIKNDLIEEAKKRLIFSDIDNMNEDIVDRFQQYLSSTSLPFGKGKNDAILFYLVLSGFFAQALDILLMCSEYKIIPYIRYDTTFSYLMLLSNNFDSSLMQEIVFKSAISHILYKNFNKSLIKDIDFIEYFEKLRVSKFSNNVFMEIDRKGLSLFNSSREQISTIVMDIFEKTNIYC